MNEIFCPTQWDSWVPCHYLNLDGFYVLAEEVYDDNSPQELSFLAHKVFGWDGELGEYTYCLFNASLSEGASPTIGTWQDKTLTLYQDSPEFQVRHIFQFVHGLYPDHPDWMYTMQVETLTKDSQWRVIARGGCG